MTSCCPVLKTTFSAQYPFSYTFVKVAYKPSIESLSDNRHCRSKYRINQYASHSKKEINSRAKPHRIADVWRMQADICVPTGVPTFLLTLPILSLGASFLFSCNHGDIQPHLLWPSCFE